MSLLVFVVFLALQSQIEAFNFSPFPNLVLEYPQQTSQERSSYFGYSLVIRQNSIIVAAPRANSTLPRLRNINEPGVIYKCSLHNGECHTYDPDHEGNYNASTNDYTWDSRHKDHQWLGGSMDGGTQDTDRFLVCAPRFFTHSPGDYFLSGMCYRFQDTTVDPPEEVEKISPLRSIEKQVITNEFKNETLAHVYIMGELGLSAHVPDDNSNFIIGAPGIYEWKGSVVLFGQHEDSPSSKASKRDTSRALRRTKRENFQSKVLQPLSWSQSNHSYFGYAVSSGYFDSSYPWKLLYVATAPQAHSQSGEAYIFAVLGNGILKFQTFLGEQFGEYFGYSVLAEDLNGDRKTDLIVSAPQHALQDSHDDGAIYVFVNRGSFNFERQIILSPAGKRGRFGTTLSRLGDINHDGYNDVAVGAPFAGNGSVFIYLGSEQGLREQPSQRLDAPSTTSSKYGEHMFGHGLSRGSDIDGNGFNDFVIGAPNAEAAYFYRSYPVVKIHASIRPESRRIKPEQDVVKITACYRLESKSMAWKVLEQELNFLVAVDTRLKRVTFAGTQLHQMSFMANARLEEQCRDFNVKMSRKAIFTPIVMEMHYELKNKISDSAVFCKTCAVVDPTEPKVSVEKITFCTGCATDVCIADLKLKSLDASPTLTLGSLDILRMNYDIKNIGENAYEPQFNVTSSPRLPFAQIPGNCHVVEEILVCDLNHGRPLAQNESNFITISFDVSQLSGESLIIEAQVLSALEEKNPKDNKQTNVISLREFTEIDATGGQTNGQTVLKNYPYSAEIVNHYEIKSHGPSTIENLKLSFYIPVAFKANSMAVVPIVNVSSLKIRASYNATLSSIDLYDQNNTLINKYQTEKRERRDLKGLFGSRDQENRTSDGHSNEMLFEDKLPKNSTIRFDCRNFTMTICVRAEMHVQLKPEKPLDLNISFILDLSGVEDPSEFFVILTDLEFLKEGDPKSSSLQINSRIEPNVISRHAALSNWVIIMSAIGGLLLLSAITYAFYKQGFFKRTLRYSLEEGIAGNETPEAEGNANADAL
ncbi:integrin alpha-PS3-like [Drosophila ficusphila]|uniref:integrin alpha-PS3-like n=1 Tax=Drosophila ficusphila TaxID=30025 RepID=UPI0007E5F363|nr:integrin alpha-PS3-like [Drosophila ficusphila]